MPSDTLLIKDHLPAGEEKLAEATYLTLSALVTLAETPSA